VLLWNHEQLPAAADEYDTALSYLREVAICVTSPAVYGIAGLRVHLHPFQRRPLERADFSERVDVVVGHQGIRDGAEDGWLADKPDYVSAQNLAQVANHQRRTSKIVISIFKIRDFKICQQFISLLWEFLTHSPFVQILLS